MSTVKMDNPTLMKLPKLAAFLNSIERNSKSSKHAYFSGLIHLNNFIFSKYSNYNCETILEPLLKNKINIKKLEELFNMKIGGPMELSDNGEWAVFDPVAKSISENLGRIKIDGVGKIKLNVPQLISKYRTRKNTIVDLIEKLRREHDADMKKQP